MLPQELIRKKRDGEILEASDFASLVRGMLNKELAEAQIGAFAMAAFLRGLSDKESADLTIAMRDSGRTLEWPDMPGPILDKHSTGGVGDCTSLLLAPMLAACGAHVPMISGRGLGHTGGTLDKLESIPGYNATPDLDTFRKVVREAGCAIIGQTDDLAPADRHLYAIRDVTATVESIPLITASILSKKLAAGLGALVMDVKFGNGAFMSTLQEARNLASSIQRTAALAGLPARAVLTNMDQPLSCSAGNSLEVLDCIAHLRGEITQSRLIDVTLALGGELLVLGNLATDETEAHDILLAALESGHAAERFQKMVSMMGGPPDLIENPSKHITQAPVIEEISSPKSGYIAHIDTRAIGIAIVTIGGGRSKPQDSVDHLIGFDVIEELGHYVDEGSPLAYVHARNPEHAQLASEALLNAIELTDYIPHIPDLIEE